MSVTITPGPYTPYQGYAIPGMKADSMFDNVDSYSARAAINFGVVVGSTGTTIKVGASNTNMKGIALHDHLIGSRGGYNENDAVSVLTRGRAWARVAGAGTGIADGAKVFVTTAGLVQATNAGGGVEMPNAKFRGPTVALGSAADVVWGGTAGNVNCAVVELHDPTYVPPAGA